jgi:hypothetical protein
MSLLFFSAVSDSLAQDIGEAIAAAIYPDPLVVYRSIDSLSRRLRQPLCDVRIVVVRLSSPQELLDIVALGERLTDLSTVLILPDASPGTAAMAHRIRPRFVAYPDTEPGVIGAVLAKMRKTCPVQAPQEQGLSRCRYSVQEAGNGQRLRRDRAD